MVYILLGTYNGERWLEAQLASIQRQTFADWRLLVRDDGSLDGTPGLLRRFAAADARIEIVEGDASTAANLGAAGNFAALMAAAVERGAACVFFADQDDVWREDKLTRQLAALEEEERRYGADTPILVHSDLELVDASLRTRARSLFDFERRGLNSHAGLPPLLVRNSVTGCATAVNRALLDLALPIPSCSPMHDWWLALCAAAAGRIRFLPDTLVKYRQHGGNQVGAASRLAALSPFGQAARMRRAKAITNFGGAVAQAKELRHRLADRDIEIESEKQAGLDSYCGLFNQPVPARRRFAELRKLGAMRPGLIGRMQVWYCLKEMARRERREAADALKREAHLQLPICDLRLENHLLPIANRKSQIANTPSITKRRSG